MSRHFPFAKLLALILLATTLACSPGHWVSVLQCFEDPFEGPPSSFGSSDLDGTWEARYMEWGIDTLVLRADGTFKQVYEDRTEDYRFETPWNEWWLQTMGDGAVRLHLEGGRYYPDDILIAELDGLGLPCPESESDCWEGLDVGPYGFYDPVQNDIVFMVGELVLNVRSDSTGELLLLHMWPAPDESFGVFTCETGQFRRVASP
jgi:hypothetical protein